MHSLTLTRFAGPAWESDAGLTPFLPVVDEHFQRASEQHPMRRWEYASALLARASWMGLQGSGAGQRMALDVGGAGSPFIYMVTASPLWSCTVIDPEINSTIEDYAGDFGPADAVFSLSVLEHVEDVDDHLDALVDVLRPGGLLFITVDAWDPPIDAEHAPDKAHFHWMRKRIFNPKTVGHLMEALRLRDMTPFGGIDLEYKGNTVYDYTFCSVSMMKE